MADPKNKTESTKTASNPIEAPKEKLNKTTVGGIIWQPSLESPPSRSKIRTLSVHRSGGRSLNVRLGPGLNLMAQETIEAVREAYSKKLESEAYEIIADVGEVFNTGNEKALKNLQGLPITTATRITVLERSTEALKQWLTDERRPAVAQAINQRLQRLEQGSRETLTMV